VPLFALFRILREPLAIKRDGAEHVRDGVTEDRILRTNDIEVNDWSVAPGKLTRADFAFCRVEYLAIMMLPL
jgi:hypothetical protein